MGRSQSHRPGKLIFPSGNWRYCSEEILCSPKSIFPTDHHYKKDISETVDKNLEPQTRSNLKVSENFQ